MPMKLTRNEGPRGSRGSRQRSESVGQQLLDFVSFLGQHPSGIDLVELLLLLDLYRSVSRSTRSTGHPKNIDLVT